MAKKDKNKQTNNSQNEIAQSAFMKHMKQNIQQKMKTQHREDVDLEKIKEQELLQQEQLKAKEHEKQKGVKVPKPVNKRVKEESKSFKEIFKRTVFAGVAGACSVVPNGSTTVLVSHTPNLMCKFYESFVSLFKPKSWADWCWNFLWMLPFIVVFLGVFILSYFIYFKIQEAGYGIALVFMFIGMSAFTIPLMYFMNWSKPKFAWNRQQFDEQTDANKKPAWIWVLFAGGFILILGISFIARFAWPDVSYPIGVSTLDQVNSIFGTTVTTSNTLYSQSIQTAFAIQVLFAGFLAGISMLIPGLSGSYLMGVLGSNNDINVAVQYAFGGHTPTANTVVSSDWAWATVVITFLGALCGIVAALFFVKYMRSNFSNGFNALIFGFYCAAFIGAFISISKADYLVLGHDGKVLGASLGLLFAPIIPIFAWMLYYQKTGAIHIKGFEFVHKVSVKKADNK